MGKGTCSIEGCTNPTLSRGWCSKHYQRWRANGDPAKTVAVTYNGRACSIDGCEERAECRGWCSMHYTRWKRTGDPRPDQAPTIKNDDQARFWARVATTSGCWLWTGSLTSDGYGQFRWGNKNNTAHRFSFVLHGGELVDGMHLDHLCRVRECVNPAHLEQVTPRENTMRGIGPGAVNAFKDACLAGHPFDEKNTYVNSRGHRRCRACASRRELERRRRAAP